MDEYLKSNRTHWDEVTHHHDRSKCYDVADLRGGERTLKLVELEKLGDVSGKSLLHLQCYFGMDTLSWERLSAVVTGIDFSEEAISLARRHSTETGIRGDFICSNLYDIPNIIKGRSDIVFTAYGGKAWLPDTPSWATIAASFLKPCGHSTSLRIIP